MKKLYLYILIIVLSSASYRCEAFGAEYQGFLSVEDYYADDSSSAYDFNILTTRLRLDGRKLNDAGTLFFHFDGRERSNLGGRDYSSIKSERIDTLNLEYTGMGKFYLSAGRLWPKELPVERVDGVNVVYQASNLGYGLFGGMKPDPYTEEFNPDYTSAGGYLFYRKESTFANLAFMHNGYKGKSDRDYLYGQGSYSPLKEVHLYGSLTADLSQSTNNWDLTNAIIEASYRSDFTRGVTVGYNRFRSFRYYRSQEVQQAENRQEAYYIRGDYRFLGRYTLYGKYERQTQDYQAFTVESRNSDIYQAGLRNDNLMGSDISTDIRATISDGYSSSYYTYSIEASRMFMEKLQVVANGSLMRNRYQLTDYSDEITNYGISGYLALSRKWNISVSYEGSQAGDYATNTVLSRVSARF